MSMLAEPRRKQKWSVDPRNSAWSNDDNKFGQKMLERMGWSKGKGLGRTEQGSTDHIKVKVKNNNYGLGANASHEDNWIAHQDEFNELLAQLNDHHGKNTSNEVPPDEMKTFSLEEKSKTSKKRVHYTKFTKGKDLSSRSETDLNCIFGKRTKSTKDQELENSRSASPVEAEESGTRAASELDTESITNTVTSSLSMQEYFAQRMAKLKKACCPGGSVFSSKAEATETPSPMEEPVPVHSSNSDAEEPKKKKKKKNKKLVDEVKEKGSDPIVVVEKENQERVCSRKKKMKTAEICDETENSCSSSVVEMNCEEPRHSKKKKRKRVEKRLINGHDQAGDCIIIQGQEDQIGVMECEEDLVTKKAKKKKKNKQE